MKRWTWLAIAAATGACSFPTSEFTIGGGADVPAADRGRVDSGAADVRAVADLGSPDAPAVTDAPADAGAGDAPTADAPDAGDHDAGAPVDSPCPPGRALCGAECVDPLNDSLHCGRCGFACNATNAAAACVGGRCETTCRPGFADCDMDPRNGCEVGLGTITSCRACGDVCPAGAALNGSPSCTANVCGTSCAAGFGDCNNSPVDGCEAPLSSPTNCGTCGHACGAGQNCAAGVCTSACTSPNVVCAGACVDPQTSAANCGLCGMVCPARPNASGACRAGACGVGACNAGFADCNGMPADGCEAPLNTVTNCGSCGRACAFPNGVAACTAGACALTGCSAANFRNCDSDPANGCERDTAIDTLSCGACGAVCRSHAGSSNPCTAGACAPTCNPGYGNCDANLGNGCEASLNTNLNCGACNRPCAAGTTCRAGACVAAAVPGYVRSSLAAPFVDACAVAGAMHLVPAMDDTAALTPLPFAFTYWGVALPAGAMVNVAANGFVSLDAASNGSLQGLIPDPAAPNGVIAVWWTDLFTSAAGVCAATTGAAPSRRFIVQWSGVNYFATRAGDMNFELSLNEAGSTIDVVYQRLAPLPPGYVPTVGIESLAGTQASVVCSTANPTCAVTAGAGFRFTPQ